MSHMPVPAVRWAALMAPPLLQANVMLPSGATAACRSQAMCALGTATGFENLESAWRMAQAAHALTLNLSHLWVVIEGRIYIAARDPVSDNGMNPQDDS